MSPDKFDALRIAVGNVDALAASVEELFDATMYGAGADRQKLERLAHLIGMTADAASTALVAVDAFNADALNPAIASDAPAPEEF